MNQDNRLAFRATPTDLANLAAIATALRNAGGQPFINRTDAMRYSLEAAARALTGK